ncbi:MAG: dinitrogenase iron-molybdenum cofactor biosynthesis protein [Proteobacteria bacterium]|nr:dinitrogenase iron-molybdenum cofactor biosynthesis protein [Pseudomonadota bacterium]MBU1397709.1 dinitrogenase iron-molybdenum cofactor biosynthesis protein [Pseudomonadota bacterium]
MNTLIAVPSSAPGGLDAPLGAHFGHCDLYTMVTVENNEIKSVDLIPNIPHQQGGCMAPVEHLAGKGASKLIAGGMGFRPLMGFNQVGIEVYFGGDFQTVEKAVQALIDGKLPQFSNEHTCGGGAH